MLIPSLTVLVATALLSWAAQAGPHDVCEHLLRGGPPLSKLELRAVPRPNEIGAAYMQVLRLDSEVYRLESKRETLEHKLKGSVC